MAFALFSTHCSSFLETCFKLYGEVAPIMGWFGYIRGFGDFPMLPDEVWIVTRRHRFEEGIGCCFGVNRGQLTRQSDLN